MNFQTSKTQSRLRFSSAVSRIALAVALTLSANGAMAATSQVHRTIKPAHAAATRQVAAAKYRQFPPQQFNLQDFVAATFGGFAVPLVTQASRVAGAHAPAASGYDNSPAIAESPAPVIVDNSQSQAAIDTTDQAIQQMDQDLFQMDETVDQQ
jgi:hypothetical protein